MPSVLSAYTLPKPDSRFTLGDLGENFYGKISAIHNTLREQALTRNILKLTGGRMPEPEEIKQKGRRIVWPNGRADWYWEKQVVLTEEEFKMGESLVDRMEALQKA